MRRLFKFLVVVLAVVGLAASAGIGYVFAAHGELVNQFWAVKDDFKAVPAERRTEVIAELPERISFEREVRNDMQALPDERQFELYAQLAASRNRVFEQFKQRIHAEAEIARASAAAKQAAEEVAGEIVRQLGKVDVGIEMTPRKAPAPRPDPLVGLTEAEGELTSAVMGLSEARGTSDSDARLNAAVGVLRALDTLGDEVQTARRQELSAGEKSRLVRTVERARTLFQDVKSSTPGLNTNEEALRLSRNIAGKLTLAD